MPGRTEEILNKVGLLIQERTKSFFLESFEHLNLQISGEVAHLERYFKLVR